MLRYDKQIKPGLVALYDIRPGNGAGPSNPGASNGHNNRYRTSLMVHMKSVLVTIVSAKTKYYEKLIISQHILSVSGVTEHMTSPRQLGKVITVVSPVQLSL